ncbi:hypothetical protein Spb1_29300 [Planctopirus ephydatiae]|uniref:Uncharacterized protein n=2 Tax=Planctopirus ephydatiae TaxID=2528019 RepID=A0A518GQW9_9PLAN|nr:hypothetical protein Spb1_29300 [Planctopirus ephydatiae]
MDAPGQTYSFPQADLRLLRKSWLCLAVLVGWMGVSLSAYADFAETFDSEQTSFRIRVGGTRSRVLNHSRESKSAQSGLRGEMFRVEILEDGNVIQAEMPISKGRALEGVSAEIFLKSNRPGAVLALKLICASTTHPETGHPLELIIEGNTYVSSGQWQKLSCTLTEKKLAEKVRPLRAKYRQPIPLSELVLHSVMFAIPADRGLIDVSLDELKVSPIVPVETQPHTSTTPSDIEQASHVDFRLDRLVVDGKPMMPRFVPWHSESPSDLRKMGLNLVWAPDWSDIESLSELRKAGLWATATPPKPKSATGENLPADEAGLPPFLPNTSPILFWNLGTRVTSQVKDDLLNWVEQVQTADRQFNRPLCADVIGGERLYSRYIDMLGMSRHVVHSSMSFTDYRRWLIEQKLRGRPGTFAWTWLQTEPSPNWRKFTATPLQQEGSGLSTVSAEVPAVDISRGQSPTNIPFVHYVEPEQIRLQAWIAATSGYRGLGFWSTSPLTDDSVLNRERRLAMTMLNLELELLEPWLATSTPFAETTFTVERRNSSNRREGKSTAPKPSESDSQELIAAVLRTESGTLVVPMWLESKSQYVPAQLAANSATILVPEGNEAAMAYEITPTGIDSRKHRRVAGGLEVVLPKFDQTAVILLTSDRQLIAQLEQRAAIYQAAYAETCLELTRLKLERVRLVDQELQQMGVGQADSPQLLGSARIYFEQAEYAFRNQDYRGTQNACQAALQLTRILQRAHWDEVVRKGNSPLSSPYSVCFQTLPLHWKLISRMGRSHLLQGENLLKSGDFESPDQLITDGWTHWQNDVPGWMALAELCPQGQESRYALRLAAFEQSKDERTPPTDQMLDHEPLLTIRSPAIEVSPGDIVYMSGNILMTKPIVGPWEGLTITDSLSGKAGYHRFQPSPTWQRFEMVRPCTEAGQLQWILELGGSGEVLIDNLQVRKLSPAESATGHSKPEGSGNSRLRGLIPRWPGRSKTPANMP